MSDGKLTYDIDFNVYTESISHAISKAVDAGFGRSFGGTMPSYSGTDSYSASRAAAASYSAPTPAGITTFLYNQARAAANNAGDPLGAAIAAQGLRANTVKLLPFVAERLGIGTPYFNNLGVTSVTEWAQAATQNPYGFTPGTAQTMIRAQVDAGLRRLDKKTDKEYVFEAEKYTNDVRAGQTFERKGLLAEELTRQGDASMAAAEAAGDPNVAIAHYQRAASRYSSVAARTLVESGAVTQEDANLATIKAVDARQRVAEIRASMRGEARKEAEIDAAWAAREKELAYSPAQKAREMEMGFRAIEASAPSDEPYNPNDPYATAYGIGNAIKSATEYVSNAGAYPFGSVGRRANIALARGAISGITPASMGKLGMSKKDIESNTQAIVSLTDKMTELERSASDGGGADGFWSTILRPAAVAGLLKAAGRTVGSIMEGRTQWLADTQTPYQTRRDVRQGWAQTFGLGAIGAGAGIGTLVAGPVGGAIGALLGAIPGLPAYLLGTHYKDEKKIGDHWQNQAVQMARYYNLYGSGVDYNYAGAIQNTGYMSRESVLQLSQTADMLPGAMAFGAVGEQEMMALSMAPNYYAALMEGRSTAEIMEAYRTDMANLPKEYRQYITSILPGAGEDLRAFTSSEWYNYLYSKSGEYRGYDQAELGVIPGLESKKFEIAHLNMNKAYQTAMEEIPILNDANYNSPDRVAALRSEYGIGVYASVPRYASAAYSTSDPSDGLMYGHAISRPMLEAINSLWTGDKAHSKLGDIIIQIDGNTVHQQGYSYEDFIKGAQSYNVGV